MKRLKTKFKRVKNRYLGTVNVDLFWIFLAIKCALVGLVGLVLGQYLYLPQGIFLFVSAISFMMIDPTGAFKKTVTKMIFSGIFAAIGCQLVMLVNHSTIQLAGMLFLLAFIALYVNRYSIAGLMALMLILLSAGLGADASIAMLRSMNILLGLLIAILFTFVIYPFNPAKEITRRLSQTLDKMADYFYHCLTDSLRGNHLKTLNYQKKIELIQFFITHREAVVSKSASSFMQQIDAIETSQLTIIFALTNILNNPIHYSVIADFLPDFENFYLVNHQLYESFSTHLKQGPAIQNKLAEFETAIDKVISHITESLSSFMQQGVIYHWPFDLPNIIYLLKQFKTQTLILAQSIKKIR